MNTNLRIAMVLGSALLLATGTARADRFGRAETNFKHNCIGCHTLAWGTPAPPERGKVDLTLAASRLDEGRLRAVLADPATAQGVPGCKHPPLVRLQVDDLVAFLRMHAQPTAPTQAVPQRSAFRRPSDPPVRPATRAAASKAGGAASDARGAAQVKP